MIIFYHCPLLLKYYSQLWDLKLLCFINDWFEHDSLVSIVERSLRFSSTSG